MEVREEVGRVLVCAALTGVVARPAPVVLQVTAGSAHGKCALFVCTVINLTKTVYILTFLLLTKPVKAT